MSLAATGSKPHVVSREAFGLALIACGQPIAWAIRGSLNMGLNPIFPAAPLVLGLLMMVQPEWFVAPKIYSDARLIVFPILLLLFPFAVISLSDTADLSQVGLYSVFLCATAFAIAMNKSDRFLKLPEAITLVGFSSCAAPFVQIGIYGVAPTFNRLNLIGNDNTLIIGDIAGVTMLASLVSGLNAGRNKFMSGLSCSVAFVTGLAAVVLSNTRSVVLALLVCIPLYLLVLSRFAGSKNRRQSRAQQIGFCLGLMIAIAALPVLARIVFSPEVIDRVIASSEIRIIGALNFLQSGINSADQSLSARWTMIEYSWQHMDIVGKGMMAQSRALGDGDITHLSYLQAVFDFGILGGLLFLNVALLIPLGLIVLRLKAGPISHTDALVILMLIFAQGDHFAHAAPYSWTSLFAVILIYLLFFECRAPKSTEAVPQ